MSALELLEKIGTDPSMSLSDLSEEQRQEVNSLIAVMSAAENKPVLSINEPSDPDQDEEPAKE